MSGSPRIMPIEEVVRVLENEAKCVERSSECDRQCNKCELAMPDKKILSAYASAVQLLSSSAMKFDNKEGE